MSSITGSVRDQKSNEIAVPHPIQILHDMPTVVQQRAVVKNANGLLKNSLHEINHQLQKN